MARDRPDSAHPLPVPRRFLAVRRSRLRETLFFRKMSLSSTRNGHFAGTHSSRGALVYAKRSFFRIVALVYAKRAFCWHPFVPRRSRLRETIIFNETVALASELGRAAPRSLRCALSCVLLRPGRSESVSSLRPTRSDERWASCGNAPLALMSCELHLGAPRFLR